MTHKITVEEVPANLLMIDERVQRQIDPRRVQRLADSWNDLMVGVLTVSRRVAIPAQRKTGPAQELVVLDGQTRLAAFRAVCSEETVAPLACQVHEGLTLQEEASIFIRHNDRKAVSPADRFRLALMANEGWAININAITTRFNWYAIGTRKDDPSGKAYTAISAVEKIYRLDDGLALRRVFETVGASWGRPKNAICSETLYGIGTLFANHAEDIDTRSLVQKLGKLGVNKFISGVTDRRRANPGMSIQRAAAEWTVDIYNIGRRSKRIG
jgi:hypothetical protein